MTEIRPDFELAFDHSRNNNNNKTKGRDYYMKRDVRDLHRRYHRLHRASAARVYSYQG